MRRAAFLLSLAVFLSGCASMRGVSVGSDETYSVNVTNSMPHTMNVFWQEQGDDLKALGSVGSGRTERFIIAGAKSPSVTVIARDANVTHTRSYPVTLSAGTPTQISVR